MIRLALILLLSGSVSAVGQGYCPNCARSLGGSGTVVVQNQTTNNFSIQLAEQKRRSAGLGPLRYDPALMRGALIKAQRAAAMGARGHIGGSFYGANKEGVGWSTSPSANACYLMTAPAGTRAGVAVVRGRGGYYTCLLIDYPGALASGRSGGPVRRVFRRRGLFRR